MIERLSVEEWLQQQTPEMQPICRSLREITLGIMCGVNEFIHHNAIGFSLSQSSFDRVCYINVQNDSYVNYGFFFGKDLIDAGQLIQGSGKRMRHVKIYTADDSVNDNLHYLIQQAWDKSVLDIEVWRQNLKKKK